MVASDGRRSTIASGGGPRDPPPPPPTPARYSASRHGHRRCHAVYPADPASPGSKHGRGRFDYDRSFPGHFSASRGRTKRTRRGRRHDRHRGRAAPSGRTRRTWTRGRGMARRKTRWLKKRSRSTPTSSSPSLHESSRRCPVLSPRRSAFVSQSRRRCDRGCFFACFWPLA